MLQSKRGVVITLMLTIKEACRLFLNQFPEQKITGVLDIGDEYVISAENERGGVSYTSPTAISKESKAFRVFFPPDNLEKLKSAVPMEIPEEFT